MPPPEMQNYGPQYEGPNHQMQQPFFQYSQCNGKKKALCIGVNYVGQSGELRGCHNDARNLRNFLCRMSHCTEIHRFVETTIPLGQYGYRDEDIVMLTDDAPNPRMIPTKDNIV